MENVDLLENNKKDFESAIATWVIDKEDSNGSLLNIDTGHGSEIKSMNKENIKNFEDSADKKSLRCFRIRKHVAYQELSSESDSDCKRKHSGDKDEHSLWNKRIKSDLSHSSKAKVASKSKINHISSTSSLNYSRCDKTEKCSLKSEEISVILSEMDENSVSNQERREKLHSIENVSNVSDNKEDNDNSQLPLKLTYTCYICDLDYQSLDDFQNHASIHRKSSLQSTSHQIESSAVQNIKNNSKSNNNLSSFKNKSDYLDTYKTHFGLNNGLISSRQHLRLSPKVDESTLEESETKIKPICTDKRLFLCNICNFNSTKLLKFKIHKILFHSSMKDLNCEYCDFQTSICVNLATHIQVHLLHCPHCDFQCLESSDLNIHLTKCHLKCDDCDFSCDSQREYDFHLKKHSIKKFKCANCKSAFPLKPQLKAHIQKYCVVSKQFKCHDCNNCFSNKEDFKRHMKSHREMYVCDICKCEFPRKNFLVLHLKIHNGGTLKCNKCDLCFTEKKNLKLHMSVHEATDLKCTHCHFQGTDENDISKHICIDKLYKVEKRQLNFQNETCDIVIENNISLSDETDKLNNLDHNINMSELRVDESETEDQPLSMLKYSTELIKKKVGRPPKGKIPKSSNLNKKPAVRNSENPVSLKEDEKIITNSKTLTLRQNLPSRRIHVNGYTSGKVDNVQHLPNKCKAKGVISKKIRNKNPRRNGAMSSRLIKKKNICVKSKKKCDGIKCFTERKQYLLKDFIKIAFGKKTSISNLLVDPVRFIGGSYVQCYYQSQSTATTPLEHVERHMRQRPILSCRLCRYKTNSQQLLQRHNAESHIWDRGVIKTLFS